ncbi:hypothetical protein [Bradyrhizobium sp. SZCCHNRI1009]|uniref:hypothetical protein n=1 Tax=Bradyrhizobium sp. SZCCHNRI1009 TaxID=3057277 RepID=UPI002915F574|nr:hypothetical protein [Bradyrhizobium sp. SZCCHNRI1009]
MDIMLARSEVRGAVSAALRATVLSAVQAQSAGQTAIVGRFALFEGVFGLSSKDGASDRSGAQAGGSAGSFVT